MENKKKEFLNLNKNDFNFLDLLKLDKFVIPKFAQVIYLISLIIITFSAMGAFFSGLFLGDILLAFGGLVFLVLSPLIIRLFIEPILVSFKSNEYLRDIRDYLYEKEMNSKKNDE